MDSESSMELEASGSFIFASSPDEEPSIVIANSKRYRQPMTRKLSPVNVHLNERAEVDLQKSSVAAQKKFQLKSKTRLNIQIKNIKLTAKWKWLDKDDTCGICRSPYESCCTSCKMPGNDCPLAIAECRHAFHMHCIRKWVRQQARSSCPLCRHEWRSPPISIFNIHPNDLIQAKSMGTAAENDDPMEENVVQSRDATETLGREG
uniref:Anaphase-promoting complex subunit 11 n=1 Tax=Panagrolaimus sp. JU765 TaxID=591449 RepID=A0AC34RCG3_9BILA